MHRPARHSLRRHLLRPLGLLLVPAVLLTSCSDDGVADGPSTTAAIPTTTATSLTIPEVDIPEVLPEDIAVTDLTVGTGAAARSGDTVVVHYVGVRSEDGAMFDNSYERGAPLDVTLGEGRVIRGWDEGLVGVQAGGRRQLDIPAWAAYGDAPPGGGVIQAGDALTFVVDVVVVLPKSDATDQPFDSLEPTDSVDEMVVEELIEGDGPVLAEGQTAAFYLLVFRADTGELLDSSWGAVPVTTEYSRTAQIDQGFITALDGLEVGGRRRVQVPAADIFDGLGSEQLGLPAGVDLTMVIDLVAAW